MAAATRTTAPICCDSEAFDLKCLPCIAKENFTLSQKPLYSTFDFTFHACFKSENIILMNFQRELRAAYGLIDCLLNGLQPTEKTALFGDLVSLTYLIISYHLLSYIIFS